MATIPTTPQRTNSTYDSHRVERGHSSQSKAHAHPYAIKTTSTALLSRSNSNTGNRAQTQHSYVPSTPSPITKHRHSKSDSSSNGIFQSPPRPLPIPPSLQSPSKSSSTGISDSSDDGRKLLWKPKRAETLPNAPITSPAKLEDLPPNPRVWTASQLASYLITALRVRSGDSRPLPLPIVNDIAGFIREARLNGRSFLRLNEQDLENMGINHLWRTVLTNASRNLRQNVLKGRIWGFDGEENESPFTHPRYNSSSSSIDLTGSAKSSLSKAHSRDGRVKGMIDTLERRNSFSSSGSASDVGFGGSTWVDEEAFASESELEDEPVDKTSTRSTSSDSGNPPIPVTPPPEILMEIPAEVVDTEPREEPSVHELLAAEEMSKSWGAKAWEEVDIKNGETMKHIGQDATGVQTVSQPGSGRRSGKGSRKSVGSHGGMRAGDIFSRPLPAPPSIKPQKHDEVLETPTRKLMKNQCVQVEVEVDTPIAEEKQIRGVQTDAVADDLRPSTRDAEMLRETQAMIEGYRARLADAEKKLDELELEKSERERKATIQRKEIGTQALESGSVTDGDPSWTNVFPHTHVDKTGCEFEDTDTLPGPAAKTVAEAEPMSTGAEADKNAHELVPSGNQVAGYRKPIVADDIEWDPLENGISSYVLMVGVGFCAVVIQTLLRRLLTSKKT